MSKRKKIVLHDHDGGRANGAPSAFWDADFILQMTIALSGERKNDVGIPMVQDIEDEENGIFHCIVFDVTSSSQGLLFSVTVELRKDDRVDLREIQIGSSFYRHSTGLDRLALEGVASLHNLSVVEVMEPSESLESNMGEQYD